MKSRVEEKLNLKFCNLCFSLSCLIWLCMKQIVEEMEIGWKNNWWGIIRLSFRIRVEWGVEERKGGGEKRRLKRHISRCSSLKERYWTVEDSTSLLYWRCLRFSVQTFQSWKWLSSSRISSTYYSSQDIIALSPFFLLVV